MTGEPTNQRPHVVKDAKGKRPQFYEAPGLDQAMSMIMVLANEMAVLRDRLDSAERVMAANGIDLPSSKHHFVGADTFNIEREDRIPA